ncbi:SRPBCC family protein [Geminicoccus flavidas]|uniref:SRPBCC family protein n=1 Tax=Geminicoccus flavidas TaxID=2506407 RepID=UPI00135CF48B|nr:SRPBCC family protein [Geminicoccus flavidas]
MPKAYASTVIDLPADRVWAVVRDFNALPAWAGHMVARSEIEDGKAADQVGCVRSFRTHDGAHIRERLLALSDVERSYSYNFETTPFDVQNYQATLRITPVTDGARSLVEWWTTFDCAPDASAQWVDTFANGVFGGGLANLRKHLAGS